MANLCSKLNALESQADAALFEWGRWARGGACHWLKYPSMSTFAREIGGSLGAGRIEESMAIKIDAALSSYRSTAPNIVDATVLYYLCGAKYHEIGEALGISARKVPDEIRLGVNFICGVVYIN
jgi:hypothetical protein